MTAKKRLDALELRSLETADVLPMIVQIVARGGRTREQVAQAAAALAGGTRIITINEVDSSKRAA